MAVQETPSVSISLFTALKQIRFLESLKPLRFSGQLMLTQITGQQWNFYLYLGNILYATGGTHPVRRWQRHLATYCQELLSDRFALQRELARSDIADSTTCWEHQLLCLWVEQQKITREQAVEMIRSVVTEVLFDVGQARKLTHQIQPDNSLSGDLVLIDVQEAIAQVQQHWQMWRDAQLITYSPNLAPTIKQPAQLREHTSAQLYQTLTKLLNGQHTLRDLASQMKRDVVQVALSLRPYIQSGLVELINIPDLPNPIYKPVLKTPATSAESTAPLIACVDDSPVVCKTMESLLTAAGYRFMSVDDAVRAFAILLARKPDVIFLDLMMPNANGYEICIKLRKVPAFQDTPILILTGNDGIVDRVRAKLVGASDFLSKPIDAGAVLTMLGKYLKERAIRH